MRRVVVFAGAVAVALVLAAVTTTLALTLRPHAKPGNRKPAPPLPPLPSWPPPRPAAKPPSAFIMVPQPSMNSSVVQAVQAVQAVQPVQPLPFHVAIRHLPYFLLTVFLSL